MGILQLIPDSTLSRGFNVFSQKDHSSGDKITVLGSKKCGNPNNVPIWTLATWDSGPCIWEARTETDDGTVSDGKWRIFSVTPEKIIFQLDTDAYYRGNAARLGDYWPHMLIENGNFGYHCMDPNIQKYYECSMDKLIFNIDIRLTEYEANYNPDDWVEAAQFLAFFYLKGKDNNDFIWFGIQMFDSRYEFSETFHAYDGGKPDASGKLIYSVGLREAYSGGKTLWKNGAPSPDGEWRNISVDMRPHLERAFSIAKADGAVVSEALSDLVIDGVNIGLETIGTFRHTVEIKKFGLYSYLDT